ncbi:hypothetical protein OGAPHI_005856 [Ogataea philodendri]|uniref:Methyltransferase type 11 domain-containing protein n=1 Tax=Ogataea philodendri TaxID=1378263 RepID=A0A9P8P015_9ASCO|nr:uncharacterized protein OGAPHI_005856 [Ogataea philodendri]KAH3662604.1 hypothetical protein OGAPHI_005856 [Ogataea philodendri]
MSGKVQPSKEEIEQELAKFKQTPTADLQESVYVHDVYNSIAQHFSQTRYKPWPMVASFLGSLTDYSIGVDVGCGNGKYLTVNPKLWIVGSDYSTGLLDQAAKLHQKELNDLVVADGMLLPHETGRFDFAVSIAVIHHFSTNERRVAAIKEILRVLKKGGQALVYCWALEQEKSRRGYKEGMEQDVLVPWVAKDGETRMRYYHLYKRGELEEDCKAAGGIISKSGYEKDNWWVVVERV